MKSFFLIISSLLFFSCSHAKLEKKVFGVRLRAQAPSQSTLDIIAQKITQFEEVNRYAMDPDCIWRKKEKELCLNPQAAKTQELEILAAKFKNETLGYFNILSKNKKDFAGLSQGYFLESLLTELNVPWLVDFAGDIYFNGNFKPTNTFTIADPLNEQLTFSEVEFKSSGYIIAASSRALGADMRNPLTKKNWQEEFQKIVLFSDKEFSGARLDAWSTALIVGGKKLLDHLQDLAEYKNHWGYIYFNREGQAICSENIDCQISKIPRKIILPF